MNDQRAAGACMVAIDNQSTRLDTNFLLLHTPAKRVWRARFIGSGAMSGSICASSARRPDLLSIVIMGKLGVAFVDDVCSMIDLGAN